MITQEILYPGARSQPEGLLRLIISKNKLPARKVTESLINQDYQDSFRGEYIGRI